MKQDDGSKANKSVDGKRTHENSPVQSDQRVKKDPNFRYNPELKKQGLKALKVQPMTSKLVQGKAVYTSPDVVSKSKASQLQRNLGPKPDSQNQPATQMGISYPSKR